MLKRIFPYVFSLLILLGFGEMVVRLVGQFDLDGNFTIGRRTLRPYLLPTETVKKNIAPFVEVNSQARMKYDSILGWSPVPLSTTGDQLYRYNKAGVRVADNQINHTTKKGSDTLRIVLIGDSFVHGDEVVYEESWGAVLEKALNENGLPAEVINLGVSAYGMDQAFLNWQQNGIKYQPDLVIFGLQMENVRRNVNLVRNVYTPNASFAFSKPRFLVAGDSLSVINQPPVAPRDIPALFEQFEKWPLVQHEYFYQAKNFAPSFIYKSKFIALLRELIQPDKSLILRAPYGNRTGVYPLNEEPAQLTLKILEELELSVLENNAELLVLHLPHIWGIGYYRKYGFFPYVDLLDKIKADFVLLDTKSAFESAFDKHKNDDFYLWFHYSKLGNEIVGKATADYLLERKVK